MMDRREDTYEEEAREAREAPTGGLGWDEEVANPEEPDEEEAS